MSNRTILIGFALVIVGGIVALIVALGAADQSELSGNGTRAGQAGAAGDGKGARGAGGAGERPLLSSTAKPGSSSAGDSEPSEPTIYMTDGGVLVRDHRRDRSKPAPLGNMPSPRDQPRRMSSGAIMAVRGALRKVVRDCERGLSTDGLGQKPRLQAVVTVTVLDETLTVDEISVDAKDVPDPGAVQRCVSSAFAGYTVGVPGQPDMAKFDQTHPFRLSR